MMMKYVSHLVLFVFFDVYDESRYFRWLMMLMLIMVPPNWPFLKDFAINDGVKAAIILSVFVLSLYMLADSNMAGFATAMICACPWKWDAVCQGDYFDWRPSLCE